MSKGKDIPISAIHFRKAYPLKHMLPNGLLPQTEEAAALWQFLLTATIALDRVEKQVTYEGDPDQQTDLMAHAESAKNMYGLKDFDGMFNQRLIDTAKRQCFNAKLPWDDRLDAFFASGGKSYRHLDRDADKIGQ